MSDIRRALIVATSSYQDPGFPDLISPNRDAEALARVLGDPSIGGFEVTILLNEKATAVSEAVEEFFIGSDPKQNDFLLLYFSGHGITDEEGRLHLVTTDTKFIGRNVRRTSAVAADFIQDMMRGSRSRRRVLILDCCYSGAFAEGMRVKGNLPGMDTHFRGKQGKGLVILTASTGTQFSFEGSADEGGKPSVYTQILVAGLESGEADLNGDGQVDLDELHEYLLEQLQSVGSFQTPTKIGYVEGPQLYLARAKVARPAGLPPKLVGALESSDSWMRLGVITELGALLQGGHPGLALGAQQALAHLRDNDDSSKVRAAADKCLGDTNLGALPAGEAQRENGGPYKQKDTTKSMVSQVQNLPVAVVSPRAEHVAIGPNNPTQLRSISREVRIAEKGWTADSVLGYFWGFFLAIIGSCGSLGMSLLLVYLLGHILESPAVSESSVASIAVTTAVVALMSVLVGGVLRFFSVHMELRWQYCVLFSLVFVDRLLIDKQGISNGFSIWYGVESLVLILGPVFCWR